MIAQHKIQADINTRCIPNGALILNFVLNKIPFLGLP